MASPAKDDGKKHDDDEKPFECSGQDVGFIIGATFLGMLTAAAVFITALAWNNAIEHEVTTRGTRGARWIYAVVVTVILTFLAVGIGFARVAMARTGGDCFRTVMSMLPETGATMD